MSAGPPQGGVFSLFPKDRSPSRSRMNSIPSRRPSIDSVSQDAPTRAGRQTPLGRRPSNRDGKKPAPSAAPPTDAAVDTAASNTSLSSSPPAEPTIQRPAPTAAIEPPPRCETAFSEAQTLVRENSTVSRHSIAKLPLSPDPNEPGPAAAPLRSLFPQYNPALPLEHQDYYPTQTSPTRIPRAAISRRLYSPTAEPPPRRRPQGAAAAAAAAAHHPAPAPALSSTEQLRAYWQVANGWRAAAGAGRMYALGVRCARDAPVYTLASRSQQPLYRLVLDPTSSTAAYVAMARFDPARAYRPPPAVRLSPGGAGGGGDVGGEDAGAGTETAAKGWQEVLATTLEPAERRHAPNDGLVAMLFPSVAAKVAMDTHTTNAAANAAAERECARLVWDDDSGHHFLVHPALAMPFCVTVERNPTWSRTEYTLEHIESPQHLARLTRDGTGTGWLEIDTGIASKIDSVYLVDVAVAALVLVAHKDGEFNRVEVFEPPPSTGSGRTSRQDRSSSRPSRLSSRIGAGEKKKTGRRRRGEFDMDLESQVSDLKKHSSNDKDGMPGCAKILISVLRAFFKCFIWCATVAFTALTACIGLLAKCVTSDKL